MAQKREKDEPLELKVPSDSSSLPSKLPSGPCSVPDPARRPMKRPRSEEVCVDKADTPPQTTESTAACEAEEPAAKKKAVNRCFGCGKRVGLTGFRCRCGDLFCSQHRYSDRHDCTYDYKAAGRKTIARENPLVIAPKIFKI